jgi:hypothetical protein
VAQAHCLDAPSGRPVRLIIAVDKSRSTLPAEMSSWQRASQDLAACLRSGDAVTVLELHSNSAQSAAVFDRELPAVSPNAALPERIAATNTAMKARKQLLQILESLFSSPRNANWTDVLGVFDRVRTDSRRQMLLVLLTDAVHSTPEFDLGRTRIVDVQFQEVLQRLAKVQAWRPDQLMGTRVYFVLPSLGGVNRHRPINDRATLQRWYQTLVAGLGGELASFSTDIPIPN